MTNNNLVTQITIRAGVEGINDIHRLADAIEETGGDVTQLRQSARELQNTWNSLSTDEQTRRLQNLSQEAQRLRNITNARMTLGLTGDEQIRAQIQEVTRAYQTLRISGTLTQEELARATQLHAQQVAHLESQLRQARPTMSDIAGEMSNIVASAGGLAYVTREAIKFEAAMADVKKVVDGTPEQIDALAGQIQKMAVEIGKSSEEIAQITAQGGQLGVPIEKLEEFTKMAAKMSVAFNLTAEEAGDAAAKMANVWNIPIENVGELGDAINTLGNNTAAKEREIVDVMNRIGGTAKQFGLAKEEAAALSAAFISLGKTPEVAGTAINAILTKLSTASVQGKDFKETLQSIGISADKMAKDINANPQAALTDFLKTLSTLKKEQQSVATFKLFGQEYVDDVSLLVGGLDTYNKALDLVADKSANAGAMQKEFEARMDTTSASLEQAKASVNVLAQTIGTHLLPIITSTMDTFTDVTGVVTDFADTYPHLTQFITLIVSAQVGLTALNSTMRLVGTMGLTSFGQLTAGATAATGAITGATTATTTLSTTLASVAKSAIALTGAFMAGNAIGDWAYNSSAAVRSLGDEMGRLLAYADAIFTDRTFDDVAKNFQTSAQQAEILSQNAKKAADEIANIDVTNGNFTAKIAQTEQAMQAISTRIEELSKYGQQSTTEYQNLAKALEEAKVKKEQLEEAEKNFVVTSRNATDKQLELANNIKITTANLEAMEIQLIKMEVAGQKGSDAHAKLSEQIKQTSTELEQLKIQANNQGIGELLKTDLERASESFKALGLDIQEFDTGVSKKAQEGLKAFVEVARLAEGDVNKLARAYNAAKEQTKDSAKAQAELNIRLTQVTNGHKELEAAVRTAAKTQQDSKKSADEQQKALDALGVSIEAINAKMSVSGYKTAENLKVGLAAIKEQVKGADNLKTAINQALDTALTSAKTKADFVAIKQAIQEAGLSAQVASEQMQKINAGANGTASSVKQLETATNKATIATPANTKANIDNVQTKKAQSQANKEVAQSVSSVADSQNKASSSMSSFASGLATIYNHLNKQVHALTSFGVSAEDANRAYLNLTSSVQGSIQMDGYWQKLAVASKRIQEQTQTFKENRQAALEMTQQLKDSTVTTRDLARAQQVLQTATKTTVGDIQLMDKTTLKNLQDQINQTKQKFADLTDSAKKTVENLQSELAGLQGDEDTVRQIRQNNKIKELEAKLQEAQNQHNHEAVASYQKALELQNKINHEENKQAADKNASPNFGGFEVQKSANHFNMSAKDVGDLWEKHLAQIKEDAKSEAKQEFIKEMHDDIKRRAR